jgi:hypothetical protein
VKLSSEIGENGESICIGVALVSVSAPGRFRQRSVETSRTIRRSLLSSGWLRTVILLSYGVCTGLRLQSQSHVLLPRRSPMYGDTLVIPWELSSKDLYFHLALGMNYGMSGRRFIHFKRPPERGLHWHISLFDLNRSRASRLSVTSADWCTDYASLHGVKSNLWCGEMRVE